MNDKLKKILFIGCNNDQIPYLKELRNKNFYIIGTDMNLSAPGVQYCDKFYNFSYNDFESLIDIGIKEKFNSYDYVFTASAQFAHLGASTFANYFKIKYPPKESISICLDKTKYYNEFLKNGLHIPKTFYIDNNQELISQINLNGKEKVYYLKSDFSKNPNYIYKFKGTQLSTIKINWERDRYFQNSYILQEEFEGLHLRLNIFGSFFTCYPFEISDTIKVDVDEETLIQIASKFKKLIYSLSIEDWLIKFDIIVNDSHWVVLDIGLDPPYRMLHEYKALGIDFYKFYINQYIHKHIDSQHFHGYIK